MVDPELQVVAYPGGLYDVVPQPHRTTWERLAAVLSTRRIRAAKEDVPGWAPIEVRQGVTRSLAAVLSVSALVLDYDGTATLEQAREAWSPWRHLGHTTWAGSPRCRIVVLLERPCPADLWTRVYDWARARDPRIDRTTRDASRFWFLPGAVGEAAPWSSWSHEGPTLELDYEALPDPRRPSPPPPRPTSGWGARRAAQARLDHPHVRRAAAARLQLGINGNGHAKGALCPQCGRPSVWWSVSEPGPARCNHRGSCGWVGSIGRVLDLAEGRH